MSKETVNGVTRYFGERDIDLKELSTVKDEGRVKKVQVIVDLTDLAVVADGVIIGVAGDAMIGARLEVLEALDSAGDNATLTIGTRNAADSEIDDNGIDDAIAESAMDVVGDVVICDGAQVNDSTGLGGELTVDTYLYMAAANTPTAGKIKLEIMLKELQLV